jgi:hypothetical protein
MEPSTLAGFIELFAGRPGVLGVDQDDGRTRPLRFGDVPLSSYMVAHLRGQLSIGVYPMHEDRVQWGCVDLDEGEEQSWEHARDVKRVLSSVTVESWIERSRSKGYHVWVFASDWTTARHMRHLLRGACEVAGAPDKEVNPKQETLQPDQLGNFVRLPYFGVLSGPIRRQVIVDRVGEPFPLDAFVQRAMHHWIDPVLIEAAASALFIEPVPVSVPSTPRPSGAWQDRLNRLARFKLSNGPREHADRSTWLYSLGLSGAESGLDQGEIVALVREADERHTGKYAARPDAERRYEDIANKALQEVMESW